MTYIPRDGEDEPWQAAPARLLMRYPVGLLRQWKVSFSAAAAGEVREGSTSLREHRIVVFVRPEWSPEKTANALAHEVGHVHDVLYFDARTRDAYMRARGLNWRERNVTVQWPAYCRMQPHKRERVACEDFCEVFALRWAPPAEFQCPVRPGPAEEELVRLEGFLVPPER